MKTSYILLFLIFIICFSCKSKSKSIYGKEYNNTRRQAGGQIIDDYMVHDYTSFGLEEEHWIIDPEKENHFRSSLIPYHSTKMIHFNERLGAFQEEDWYIKVISKNRSYQITVVTNYDNEKHMRKKFYGYLMTYDHGQFVDSLDIELDMKKADSLLYKWKLKKINNY